jgi:hypothetical protein
MNRLDLIFQELLPKPKVKKLKFTKENIKVGQIWSTKQETEEEAKKAGYPAGKFKITRIEEDYRLTWNWIEGGFSPRNNPRQDGTSFNHTIKSYNPIFVSDE